MPAPSSPASATRNWVLPDPAGQSVDAVRPIRDDIEERVRRLLDELDITPTDCETSMTETARKPSVLFVCVKNGGKSQMAAGLMSKIAGDTVQVYSAGTRPGTAVNDLSAQALAEVGVDITGNTPTLIDPQLVRDVDVVVTLGREARVDPVPGTRFEYWDTDEPSERGIDGIERMRLVRDDIAARVADLLDRMQTRSS